MDRQKVFNIGVMGIISQGGPSMDVLGCCRYRGDNGCKCIIGHLIDDSAYRSAIECKLIADSCVKNALTDSGLKFGLGDIRFLERMQMIHDNAAHMARDVGTEFFYNFAENIQSFTKNKIWLTPEVERALNARLGI